MRYLCEIKGFMRSEDGTKLLPFSTTIKSDNYRDLQHAFGRIQGIISYVNFYEEHPLNICQKYIKAVIATKGDRKNDKER